MQIFGMILLGAYLWVIVSLIFFVFSRRFLTHVSDEKKVSLQSNQTLDLKGEQVKIVVASHNFFTLYLPDGSKVLVGQKTNPPIGWSGDYFLSESMEQAAGTWLLLGELVTVEIDGATKVTLKLTSDAQWSLAFFSIFYAAVVVILIYLGVQVLAKL